MSENPIYPGIKFMKFVFSLIFLILLTAPIELHAQITEPDKFQNDKSLVRVPVIVSDREGHYITDLKKEDFSVYQDGVPQKITFFATYDEPLSIALLIDTSGSTRENLENIKDAGREFINLLKPNDQCLLATFDSQLNILNPFSTNHQNLKDSLNRIQTAEKEGTVLRNAIKQIFENSFVNVEGRKVIVLLSDGKDFGSSVTKEELLNQLEESDILIYSIFYKTGITFNKVTISSNGTFEEIKPAKPVKQPKPVKKKVYTISIPAQIDLPTEEDMEHREKAQDIEAIDTLKKLSDTTAGRFYTSDASKLKEVFKQIISELSKQYVLGYQANDQANDQMTHDINVKVGRAEVVVRTRGKFRTKRL